MVYHTRIACMLNLLASCLTGGVFFCGCWTSGALLLLVLLLLIVGEDMEDSYCEEAVEEPERRIEVSMNSFTLATRTIQSS